VQQRTSGGCWRTLQGLIDFAVVQSYLSTVGKWGLDKLDALEQLFTTGAWLPHALTGLLQGRISGMNVQVAGDAEEIEWGGVRREGELPTRVSDRTTHPAKEVHGD
jgi:hypothetical protein